MPSLIVGGCEVAPVVDDVDGDPLRERIAMIETASGETVLLVAVTGLDPRAIPLLRGHASGIWPWRVAFSNNDDVTSRGLLLSPAAKAEVVHDVGSFLGPLGLRSEGPSPWLAADTSPFIQEVVTAVVGALQERADEYRRVGRNLFEEWVASELGRSLVLQALPEPSPWSQFVGPVLTRQALISRLSLTPGEVDRSVEDGRLLELETSDGVLVYPEYQLQDGARLPGFSDVLQVFDRYAVTSWTLAAWFYHKQEEWGQSVIDMLRDRQVDLAMATAREAARRFTQ